MDSDVRECSLPLPWVWTHKDAAKVQGVVADVTRQGAGPVLNVKLRAVGLGHMMQAQSVQHEVCAIATAAWAICQIAMGTCYCHCLKGAQLGFCVWTGLGSKYLVRRRAGGIILAVQAAGDVEQRALLAGHPQVGGACERWPWLQDMLLRIAVHMNRLCVLAYDDNISSACCFAWPVCGCCMLCWQEGPERSHPCRR